MHGINKVSFSGHVGSTPNFNDTTRGVPACSFRVCSERKASQSKTLTTWAKINVYGEDMVSMCRRSAEKDAYIIIDGELMNREGPQGEMTEIRARELIFPDDLDLDYDTGEVDE